MHIISPKEDFCTKELFSKEIIRKGFLSDVLSIPSIYKLRDEKGIAFSNLFEIHIIELCKQLNGKQTIDNWIRFFNAESVEDLDMIHTKNIGLQTAIEELKTMSLSKKLQLIRETKLKERRDRRAREEYVREQGFYQGMKPLVRTCIELGVSKEDTINKLEQHFLVSQEIAEKCYSETLQETE